MTRRFTRAGCLLLAMLPAAASPATGQQADSVAAAPRLMQPLPRLGGPEADRARAAMLVGDSLAHVSFVRSTHTQAPPLAGEPGTFRWAVVAPELRSAWNSQIPLSLNDGSMWAGRGLTTWIMAGARAQYGPVSVILAPEVGYVQNRSFVVRPSSKPGFSSFVPPWYTSPPSLDLPYRPGDRGFAIFTPGQSSIAVTAGPVQLGAATEDQWWGPGIRNAIVLSNNAPGIPHAFARTAAPLRTPIGWVEATWMAGALTESLYFDSVSTNNLRSISGLAVSLRTAWDPDLTLGLARVVYAPMGESGDIPGHSLDVFTRWNGPARVIGESAPEQITSLFWSWIFPRDGLELYGEWAHLELPTSFRDLLLAPEHTQGYTLGLQWANELGDGPRLLRFQTELTDLEQSSTAKYRPTSFFYVSRSIPQGYTNRGQVVGAAIGPGASSQWLALDYLAPDWQAGVFGARIRWANDAYYRSPNGTSPVGHDVSVLGGVRASARLRFGEVTAEIVRERRLNYLFQNVATGFGKEGAVDVGNTLFRLSFRP